MGSPEYDNQIRSDKNKRYAVVDCIALPIEAVCSQEAYSRMIYLLCTTPPKPEIQTPPLIVVPGALEQGEVNESMRLLRHLGLRNTHRAEIATHGPIMPQVNRLIEQARRLGGNVIMVGYSLGGSEGMIAAQKGMEHIKGFIAVSSPLNPPEEGDFNSLLLDCNDLRSSKEVRGALLQKIPEGVHGVSLVLPNNRIINPDVCIKEGVQTVMLAEGGHHAAYFDVRVGQRIAVEVARMVGFAEYPGIDYQ